MVARGFSSMIQWPESGMTPSRTLLAANCMISAIAGAERLLAADGEDRHRQLALGHERLVVDRILVERGELHEAGMHRARQRVELGIVLRAPLR